MRTGIGVFLALILLVSCSSSPVPKGILPPDKIYPVVKDIIQVDEYISEYLMKDSTIKMKQKRSILYTQVFILHNTNQKEFYKSYAYYQQHPNLMKTLLDSLTTGLKKKEYKKAIPTQGKVDSLLQ